MLSVVIPYCLFFSLENRNENVAFNFLTAETTKNMLFRVVMLCSSEKGTYHLHLVAYSSILTVEVKCSSKMLDFLPNYMVLQHRRTYSSGRKMFEIMNYLTWWGTILVIFYRTFPLDFRLLFFQFHLCLFNILVHVAYLMQET
jgi:hypothetical protein